MYASFGLSLKMPKIPTAMIKASVPSAMTSAIRTVGTTVAAGTAKALPVPVKAAVPAPVPAKPLTAVLATPSPNESSWETADSTCPSGKRVWSAVGRAMPTSQCKAAASAPPLISAAVMPKTPTQTWSAPTFGPTSSASPSLMIASTPSGGAQLVALPPSTPKTGWSKGQIALAIAGVLGLAGLGYYVHRRRKARR